MRLILNKQTLLKLVFAFTLPFILVSQTSVAALGNTQRELIDSSIYYYNLSAGNGCSPASDAVNLVGRDREEKTWNFFKAKGLSDKQVAGIMGNMMQESSFDPQIMEIGGRSKDPYDAGTKGWGIIQWSGNVEPTGDKFNRLFQQSGLGGKIYELSTQLNLVWAHMNNHPDVTGHFDLKHFKSIADEKEAAVYFRVQIEGGTDPIDPSTGQPIREKYATEILNKYSGSTESASGVAASISGGDCSTVTSPGEDTRFIDGFTVFNQCDPKWADKPYATSTICVSGCGPSAMAMIITNLTGTMVTPVQTSNYAASHDMYIEGAGSSWSISPVLARHWGLKATPIGADVAKINAALQSGALVITSGQGPLPFTSGGHFIVIRGVTADGKWKVGDSGHKDTNDKNWDPEQLLVSMNGGSVYAISK